MFEQNKTRKEVVMTIQSIFISVQNLFYTKRKRNTSVVKVTCIRITENGD